MNKLLAYAIGITLGTAVVVVTDYFRRKTVNTVVVQTREDLLKLMRENPEIAEKMAAVGRY
jgi:hypothetical protein